jgi:predicted nuclease of predicted toxin-antitoxin system
MKLLLDMNLPPAWATRFCNEGFETLHWTAVGPGNLFRSRIRLLPISD